MNKDRVMFWITNIFALIGIAGAFTHEITIGIQLIALAIAIAGGIYLTARSFYNDILLPEINNSIDE